MSTTQPAFAPRYAHDCSACSFLGRHGDLDLYHCPQHGLPTLIARASSRPGDYVSLLADSVREFGAQLRGNPLAEAFRRARALGLPLGCAA